MAKKTQIKAQNETVDVIENVTPPTVGDNVANLIAHYPSNSLGDAANSFDAMLRQAIADKAENKLTRKALTIADLRAELSLAFIAIAQIVEHRNSTKMRQFLVEAKPMALTKTVIRTTIPNMRFVKDVHTGESAITFDDNDSAQYLDKAKFGKAAVDIRALQELTDAYNLPAKADPRSDTFKSVFAMPEKTAAEKQEAVIKSLRKLAKDQELSVTQLVELAKKALN